MVGVQQYVDKRNIALGKQPRTKIEAGNFYDSIKHDFRSLSYTTKWSDIPKAEK